MLYYNADDIVYMVLLAYDSRSTTLTGFLKLKLLLL